MSEDPTSTHSELLGYPVIYRTDDKHGTKTIRSGVELHGSIFHAELTEFAGIVGRVNDDGTADIALLIPNNTTLSWVTHVPEGEGPGHFRTLGPA